MPFPSFPASLQMIFRAVTPPGPSQRDDGAEELCSLPNAKAMLRRPKTGQQICKECFFRVIETEIHNIIVSRLFKLEDRVAIGASGGKGDAPAFLLYQNRIYAQIQQCSLMKTLNER